MKSGKQLLLYHNLSDKMQSCSPIALVCTGLLMGDSGSTSTGVILLLPLHFWFLFCTFMYRKLSGNLSFYLLPLFFLTWVKSSSDIMYLLGGTYQKCSIRVFFLLKFQCLQREVYLQLLCCRCHGVLRLFSHFHPVTTPGGFRNQ